jgi:hypothetical protein
MIKPLRYYIKSLYIKKCLTLMKFRILLNNGYVFIIIIIISVIIPFRFPTPRYSYPPPVMLRPLKDPAIPSEAVVDDPAPGWLCARRSPHV